LTKHFYLGGSSIFSWGKNWRPGLFQASLRCGTVWASQLYGLYH